VPASLTIRDSGPHEAETLFELQRAASLAAVPHIFPPELYPYPDDAIRERWRTVPGRIFVAERDGVPVGVAAVEAEWLSGLYVVPDEWGSGVADALHTAAVEAIAGAHDAAKLWCLEENRRARRFYEKRGWRPNGETRVVPFPPNPVDVGYSLALPRSA
jgi:GNAT superfamily N-acetyltransferase